MTEEDPIVECSGCGTSAPRSQMFGVEPDLLCARCASGVRKRLHVRYRPRPKYRAAHATVACLAVAASLFVATHILWPAVPGRLRPDWIPALHQGNEIWQGAVWKHVTSMFLHGGWIHIIFNGMALWGIGRIVESRWGSAKMLGLLLMTGAAGGAMEFIAQPIPAVGLSGGILGLCGFLIALRRADPVAGAVMHDGNVRYVLGFVVACAVATMLHLLNIANWAHGAGLATGWLFGRASLHAKRVLLVPAVAVLCLGLVVASIFLAFGTATVTYTERGLQRTEEWPRQKWRRVWLQQQADRSS